MKTWKEINEKFGYEGSTERAIMADIETAEATATDMTIGTQMRRTMIEDFQDFQAIIRTQLEEFFAPEVAHETSKENN